MFWPENYMPVRQLEYWLHSRIQHVASAVAKIDRGAPKRCHEIDELPESGLLHLYIRDMFKDEKGRPRKLHEDPKIEKSLVVSNAVGDFLMDCPSVSVFLPASTIARVHLDELHCSEADLFDDGTSEANLFVDKLHWTISTLAAEHVLEKYENDPQRSSHSDGIRQLRNMIHAVSPWNCASIVFREDDLPSPNEIDNLLFRSYRIQPVSPVDETRSGGRPRKQEAAAQAFLRHWPDKDSPSWKVVLQTLKEQNGLEVSVETIRRGLRALENNDEPKP